jgi:uncharacterized membrane protein YphA (DoxX/SURF4 family)
MKISLVRPFSLALLAALFLYAGIDKALHYGGFIKALGNYVLVPDGYERHLALPLILIEILAGCGLLIGSWRSPAALLSTGLLTVFTVALVVNHHYAPGVECGCWFTITLGRATTTHVLQNIVLLGLAFSIWLDERGRAAPKLSSQSIVLPKTE